METGLEEEKQNPVEGATFQNETLSNKGCKMQTTYMPNFWVPLRHDQLILWTGKMDRRRGRKRKKVFKECYSKDKKF
jgi:hypothetical protein